MPEKNPDFFDQIFLHHDGNATVCELIDSTDHVTVAHWSIPNTTSNPDTIENVKLNPAKATYLVGLLEQAVTVTQWLIQREAEKHLNNIARNN